MGYYVTMDIGGVIIPADKVEDCLNAVNAMFSPIHRDKMSGGSFQGGKQTGWHYSWVNAPGEGGFATLKDALEEWRYSATVHENGDVEIDYFNGEKWGDDPQLYDVLAPFVVENDPNPVIFCRGEDGHHWKHVFKNGICEEVDGKVVYEDDPDWDD